jgi:hypothetical protein
VHRIINSNRARVNGRDEHVATVSDFLTVVFSQAFLPNSDRHHVPGFSQIDQALRVAGQNELPSVPTLRHMACNVRNHYLRHTRHRPWLSAANRIPNTVLGLTFSVEE